MPHNNYRVPRCVNFNSNGIHRGFSFDHHFDDYPGTKEIT